MLVAQSGSLGLDHLEESDRLVIVGCTGDVGPLRFDLTTVGVATDIIVSIDRRDCAANFG